MYSSTAVMINLVTLIPDNSAAERIFSPSAFSGLIVMLSHFLRYLVAAVSPSSGRWYDIGISPFVIYVIISYHIYTALSITFPPFPTSAERFPALPNAPGLTAVYARPVELIA